MAHYPKLKQTSKGRELIAKSSVTGRAIIFTKIVTGDGNLTNENIEAMSALIAPKLELPFTAPGKVIGDGQFQVEFAMSNANVNNGFYAREIGVYAKLDGESDSNAKLIAYTNGGNLVDYIPNKDTPVNSKVFQLDVVIGDADTVNVQRSDMAYITKGAMDTHNSIEDAHSAVFTAHNNDKNAHKPITDVIKALKGTSAFDTSVSKSVTEIITLLGMGGIVAAKLDANAGFVKFANGFIIQWIENESVVAYDYKKYELTFPIAFGANCIGAWISIGNSVPVSGVEVFYFDKKSTTGITLIADSSHAQATVDRVVCLALGF